MFKAEYNITPSRYVGELRLNMAKNLMQNNPELRVKDVAELVGFTDYFYFSRVFKSHEGVTPSQYIKVLMQDDVFRDFEKIPPLVEFSLQKSQNSCYTYKK
nr:helix-turn-helix transcriptional regulator [Blautia obeum]